MNQYCLMQSQRNTTDSNPCRQFLLTVMAGLLQLERELTSTRVKEGLTALRGKMNLSIENIMPTKIVSQSHYGGTGFFRYIAMGDCDHILVDAAILLYKGLSASL